MTMQAARPGSPFVLALEVGRVYSNPTGHRRRIDAIIGDTVRTVFVGTPPSGPSKNELSKVAFTQWVNLRGGGRILDVEPTTRGPVSSSRPVQPSGSAIAKPVGVLDFDPEGPFDEPDDSTDDLNPQPAMRPVPMPPVPMPKAAPVQDPKRVTPPSAATVAPAPAPKCPGTNPAAEAESDDPIDYGFLMGDLAEREAEIDKAIAGMGAFAERTYPDVMATLRKKKEAIAESMAALTSLAYSDTTSSLFRNSGEKFVKGQDPAAETRFKKSVEVRLGRIEALLDRALPRYFGATQSKTLNELEVTRCILAELAPTIHDEMDEMDDMDLRSRIIKFGSLPSAVFYDAMTDLLRSGIVVGDSHGYRLNTHLEMR